MPFNGNGIALKFPEDTMNDADLHMLAFVRLIKKPDVPASSCYCDVKKLQLVDSSMNGLDSEKIYVILTSAQISALFSPKSSRCARVLSSLDAMFLKTCHFLSSISESSKKL